MDDELIVECRKCGQFVYITEPTLEKVANMTEYDCPDCGEEGYENWIIRGKGHYERRT